MTSYQWSIEILNRGGGIEECLYATELCKFEGKVKLLQKGKAELCLIKVEGDTMLFAYPEGAKLKGFIIDWEIPERFTEEYIRWMNKTRSTERKRKEVGLPNVVGRVSLNDRIFGKRNIIVKGNEEGKIAVRINSKTILFLNKGLSAAEVDVIIKKYTKI